MEFSFGSAASSELSPLDRQVTANAQGLSDETPGPRQARIVGKLDMVRHSTRSFGSLLEDEDEIRGVLVDGTSEVLQGYFGKEITISNSGQYTQIPNSSS